MMPKRDHRWFLHSLYHVDMDQSWWERGNLPTMCLSPQMSMLRRCDTHTKAVQKHMTFAQEYTQILTESNRGPWSLVPDNLLSRAAYSKSGWRGPILFNSEGLYHKEGSRGTDLGQVKVKIGLYRSHDEKQKDQRGEHNKHLWWKQQHKTPALVWMCVSTGYHEEEKPDPGGPGRLQVQINQLVSHLSHKEGLNFFSKVSV